MPLVLLCLSAWVGVSTAADRELRILEALIDSPERGVVTLRGTGFPTGRLRALVCLGELSRPLRHTVVDATEIQARLPEGLATGSYRLTVRVIAPIGPAPCPDRMDPSAPLFDAFELALSEPTALEIQHALCDGGAPNPRPGICPGRCTCSPVAGVGPVCTVTETSPGDFLFERVRTVNRGGVCRVRADGNRCSASGGGSCGSDPECAGGQTCVIDPVTEEGDCRYPCASDADCGPLEITERTSYLGVGEAGSRNLVTCERPPFGAATISNNDALACLETLNAACAP